MSSFSLVYANFAGLAVYNESIGITAAHNRSCLLKHKSTIDKSLSRNQEVADQKHNLILLSVTSQSLEFCSLGFIKFCKREIFLKQKPGIGSRCVSVEHIFLRQTLCVRLN